MRLTIRSHRASLAVTGVLLSAWAATAQTPVIEGSSLVHRSNVDFYPGQLNIYVGAPLPKSTHLQTLSFLFDQTATGTLGYITPLLFQFKSVEAATIYTVVGIGKSHTVSLSTSQQSVPFTIVQGTKVPTSGNFTWGYITALVDSSGNPTATSTGVADYDDPTDGGMGVGGSSTTNDWAWTAGGPTIVVALGTTFGIAGNANPGYNGYADFILGQIYRTYSVQIAGEVK